MIRMGRKDNTSEPVTPTQEQPKTNFGIPSFQQNESNYRSLSENIPSSSRPIAETESMARDIKEGRLSGFVGNGTMLTGETSFKAMLRVDGHLTGKVISDSGTLVVGTSGQVDANISVSAAVINGTVNGDIIATEKIELGRTARVIGNIQTPSIRIEDGALFEGNCLMMKQRNELEKRAKTTAYDNKSGSVAIFEKTTEQLKPTEVAGVAANG